MTANLKDFPEKAVPRHIQVLSPALFAANTVSLNPPLAKSALATIARRYNRSPQSVFQLLGLLESRYAMTRAVNLLRAA